VTWLLNVTMSGRKRLTPSNSWPSTCTTLSRFTGWYRLPLSRLWGTLRPLRTGTHRKLINLKICGCVVSRKHGCVVSRSITHTHTRTHSHTPTYPHTHRLTHVNSILSQYGNVCVLLSSQARCTLSPERFRLERHGFCAKTGAQYRVSKHDCTLCALSGAHASPAKHALRWAPLPELRLERRRWCSKARLWQSTAAQSTAAHHARAHHARIWRWPVHPPAKHASRLLCGVLIFNKEGRRPFFAKILASWTVLRKMNFSHENQTKGGHSVCFAHLFLQAWRKRTNCTFF